MDVTLGIVVAASQSTRAGFGITLVESMTGDRNGHRGRPPDSTADEAIGVAGLLATPTAESLTTTVDAALRGDRPPTNPVDRAHRYDWDTIAVEAEAAYRRTIDGAW